MVTLVGGCGDIPVIRLSSQNHSYGDIQMDKFFATDADGILAAKQTLDNVGGWVLLLEANPFHDYHGEWVREQPSILVTDDLEAAKAQFCEGTHSMVVEHHVSTCGWLGIPHGLSEEEMAAAV